MNKNLKKLGLLVVTAIAMAMGVNSASALTIGTRTNDFDENPVVGDGYVNTATVSHTGLNTYTITLNGDFANSIVVRTGEKVTIELNGKTLNANINNAGSLVINGDANSNYVRKITNTGDLTINGGNFVKATITEDGSIHINGIGTAIPTSLADYISDGFKGVPTESLTDSYLVLAEADAYIGVLEYVLAGKSTSHSEANVAFTALNESLYTKSSFSALKAQYDIAKALVDEYHNVGPIPVSRQGEIDEAIANYCAAFKGLRYLATTSYTKVEKAIADAQDKLDNAERHGITYTNASLKVLNDAIEYAKANNDLPGDVNKWNQEVDDMATAIDKARQSLKEKADYSKIEILESVIDKLDKDDYSSEEWAVLEYVRNNINRDMPVDLYAAGDKKGQAAVDEYYQNLLSALNAVLATKKVNTGSTVTPGDDEPSNPGTTKPSDTDNDVTDPGNTTPGTTDDENNNSGATVNPNTGATGTTSDVNTSDNVAVYAIMNIASLIALAGCGLVLRKQN